MMTIEVLKTQLAVLADRIAALETVEQPEAEWPKDGDTYFFIDGDGDVLNSQWDSDLRDTSRMNIGNVFRTVAEAEHEIDRRKVLTTLRRLARESWGKTKIDWENAYQAKWEIYYCRQEQVWDVTSDGWSTPLSIYFYTAACAEDAIRTIGAERLMLLLED